MKRTQFLHTLCSLGVGSLLVKTGFGATDSSISNPQPRLPRYLHPGDTIAITCPAGIVLGREVSNCIATLKSWGFKIKVGSTVGSSWQRYAGTDAARAADLQACLDDPAVSAVLFGRGGYGVMRILDSINWEKFVARPKWLVGFSDITAIHCHLNAVYKIPTIHAPMATAFGSSVNASIESIRSVLTGKLITYTYNSHKNNIYGQTTAELIGGNLSMIYAMQASKSEIETNGKILLIEDVGEYKYVVDRMLMNLKRSGKLENLAGLIVGGFGGIKQQSDPEYNMEIEDLIFDKIKEYGYPVSFKFPAGHQRKNMAVKLGVKYQLNVGKALCSLSEIRDNEIKPAAERVSPDTLQVAENFNSLPANTDSTFAVHFKNET